MRIRMGHGANVHWALGVCHPQCVLASDRITLISIGVHSLVAVTWPPKSSLMLSSWYQSGG